MAACSQENDGVQLTSIVSNCMAGPTFRMKEGKAYKRFHLKKTLLVGPLLIFALREASGDTGVFVSLASRSLPNRSEYFIT